MEYFLGWGGNFCFILTSVYEKFTSFSLSMVERTCEFPALKLSGQMRESANLFLKVQDLIV